MENRINKKQLILLPTYFKWVGLATMALSVIANIVLKQGKQELVDLSEVYRTLTLNGFILGIFFLALSKDKVEDEMTMSFRLRSMSFSFIGAIIMVVVRPVIDILSGDTISMMSSQSVVMSMLIVYVASYYLNKRVG